MKTKIKELEKIVKEKGIPSLEVLEVFTKFNYRVYSRYIAKGNEFVIFKPELEDETFDLTKRYFEIYGGKK